MPAGNDECTLLREKRTWRFAARMSALDPKRTSLSEPKQTLNVEIKMELKGVGPQRDGIDFFFPLVGKPRFNDILGEHIPTQQKRMIGFECIESLLQRARCRLHGLCFRRRQIV